MVDEKQATAPPKKGSVKKAIAEWVAVFAVIGLLVYAFGVHQGPWPWEAQPTKEAPQVSSADVVLYRFSDLNSWSNKTNGTMNVEVWVKNIGETTAQSVSVFVRVRDQNGTIEYMDDLDLTWQVLGDNETASGTYTVHYDKKDLYLESTIEIRWSTGMHSYLKKTDLWP